MTATQQRGKTFKDLVTEAKTRINEVTQDEFKQWLTHGEEMIVLDVREPDNYKDGHVAGAVSVPRGILEIEIDEVAPDQNAKVVLYCGGGSRSALAADTLQVMGYTNVFSLTGGWRQYSQ